MDIYDSWFKDLSVRLKSGRRFGLKFQMDGEGRFKDFQGESEIPELRKFIDRAREDKIEDIVVRDGDAEGSVINEQ